ncbi:hypothetical protein DBV05_g389 [Lasiodiplodia theobromae]|uniref:Uncharacterized protein n=1 Tax=Lasiodiplodia theobromae TaxID=45133 RepID=A0A5N5DSC8_9PEZI|nr:hypothetical protein DBV05_g389 [Lasiodiplodia theobromae]
MASSTTMPYTCLTIAEWRPDGWSGPTPFLGRFVEKPVCDHLSAKFKFENHSTGPYAAIHLEVVPNTVSDKYDRVSPDQTISVVITADNINSISQDDPGVEYLSPWVTSQYSKYEARMNKQGISSTHLKQAIRLRLTLKRAPIVLMPLHVRSLTCSKDMRRLQILKSFSTMTSFVLFFVRSDRMINNLRQFRTGSKENILHGGPAAVFNNRTHFSFSGPDEAHWNRYRVRQDAIAPLGQKRSLQDNHGNSPTSEGSHGVKRTKHDSTPAYGPGLLWTRQSEPPMPNPHFGQTVPQSVFTSGTATLENTQAKTSDVPNTDSNSESAPNIFNRNQASFMSSGVLPFRSRASSVTDHITRRDKQVSTSASMEPFETPITKLQIKGDPASSSDSPKPPTAANNYPASLVPGSTSSGLEDDRWKQYQVETSGITDSEQAPTVSKKKKKSHPPRRRYRPGHGEDGNDPKRTGEDGFANGSSTVVSHVEAGHVLPSHTSFCPVLHSSSAANSSSVIATGTQAQSTLALTYPHIGPDEMVKRWRAYHDWTLLSCANFGLDTMLDIQGLLSSSLRAARAGDVTTFADKLADIFMLVDENKDEHQG